MKKTCIKILFGTSILLAFSNCHSQMMRTLKPGMLQTKTEKILPDTVGYHKVHVDESGKIIPWYSENLGKSYDNGLKLVWNFWNNMELDTVGVKYYMNHQVWRPNHDRRGIGGDQVMMALSSWDLLYNYLGDQAIIDNMKYQADYYLDHSLSAPTDSWPNLPYPYNTDIESGIYDGDMRGDKEVLQPDKAGSFGFELLHLYKKTGEQKYLEAAINIANTLSDKVKAGDAENSPWPFKVSAKTGEVPNLGNNKRYPESRMAGYTTNWTSTLGLFSELVKMHKGNVSSFKKAFDLAKVWLKKYPANNNEWGPFFEDIVGYSNTQTNAITYAMFLMENPNFDPQWKQTVKHIFQWVHKELGNNEFIKYGVFVTNEQTVYLVPGNSHSSRQASMELLYWSLTGDTTYTSNAIRELSWATYTVDKDGKNFYPRDDIWMTDGYGDYVRHYIRAMAAAPQLAPDDADHLLKTSSIVQSISYNNKKIFYKIFDNSSKDLFRLSFKPSTITVNNKPLQQKNNNREEGWQWQPLDKGGILMIVNKSGNDISIMR